MMISLARLVLRSALFREETRGHHVRTDYPSSFAKAAHTLAAKGKEPFAGEVKRMTAGGGEA